MIFLPDCMTDYEFISKLYDVDITIVKDCEYKNDTDRFEYVIELFNSYFQRKQR